MKSFSKSFRKCECGVSALEFALALPLLLTLFFGGLETAAFLLASQKTEKLAATTADVIAQSEVATNAGLTELMGAAAQVMAPLRFDATNGQIVVSSIYRPPNLNSVVQPTIVNWQRFGVGGGPASSRLGAEGARASLPAGFVVAERENVIVAEIVYTYRPIFPGFFMSERQLYRRAFFKPRLGALTQAPI